MEVKIEDAAEKAGITATELELWEREEREIPLSIIRVLQQVYGKPLASFLLPSPPRALKKPTDHRTFRGGVPHKSKALLLAIHRAQRMQVLYQETLTDKKSLTTSRVPRVSRGEAPEEAARRAREDFGLTLKTQFGWADQRVALGALVRLIEAKNVLVFQLTFDPKDARGFTLPQKNPSVIVLSSSDSVRARIFTLLHEYCHLLLAEEGISDWNTSNPIERFCNRFASAFLVPSQELRKHPAVQEYRGGTQPDLSAAVKLLVKDFKVSSEVILTCLFNARVISKVLYDEEVRRIAAQVDAYTKRRKRGGPPPATKCVSQRGVPYVSAVISANKDGRIVLSEVSDYLGVRQKHIRRIESLIRRNTPMYGTAETI